MDPANEVPTSATVPVRRGQQPPRSEEPTKNTGEPGNPPPPADPTKEVRIDGPELATVPGRRGQPPRPAMEPAPPVPPVAGQTPVSNVPSPQLMSTPESATVSVRGGSASPLDLTVGPKARAASSEAPELQTVSVRNPSSTSAPLVPELSPLPALKPLDLPPEINDSPEEMHVMSMQRIRELRAAAAQEPVAPAAPPPDPLCPRCQTKLISPTTLGLCPKCGYCRSLEENKLKVTKPAVKKRRFSLFGFVEFCELLIGLPSWFWILVLGFGVVTGLSVAVAWYVPAESPWRSSWSTLQLVTGVTALILAQFWALVLVAPHAERVSPKDLFFLSANLWGLTWRRLPETRRPIWLACWGLGLAGYALFLIGGVSEQLPNLSSREERVVDRELHESVSRASPQQAENVRRSAAQEIVASPGPPPLPAPVATVKDDRPTVTCRVIGYRPREDGSPGTLVLEIWRNGKLSYAGEVAQGVGADEDLGKHLVPLKRQLPTVPDRKAIWVEPQYCDVHHSGFDDKGHLKAPRFKGWGKAPEKGGE